MRKGSRPVLLVEDNHDDVELALCALAPTVVAGRVDVAHDGEEALAYLSERSDDSARLPFLVLLDIALPRMDGFEVLRRIRMNQRVRGLPVVVLTSSGVREDIVRAYEFGANSFVRKPVEFSEYSETVRRIGEYWIRFNEIAE